MMKKHSLFVLSLVLAAVAQLLRDSTSRAASR